MALGGKREGAGRKPDLTKQAIAEAYTKALAEEVEKNRKPLIAALIRKAKTGDIPALREIHERLLGKVAQPLSNDVSGEPLKLQIVNFTPAVKVNA